MRRIFFFILLLPSLLFSQRTDTITHQKIGLVLSGGGAKGLAHIGVLKELEKRHIYPDFIAGTSMGAIVGSLYASGYSAQQIDSIFKTLNFDEIMFDKQDRKYKTYFRKKSGVKFILKLPFSLKEMSVQIPKGLADSQSLFNTMAINLLHVHNIDDFNKLRIPFLCIATDISSGEQVLFNKGYLPEAVTSSALLPTVYKPLELNNKLLLDGGIVNNYPIKELRDMGADIIIGSDVQGKILNKEQIKDLPAIMDQIISFQMYKEMPLKKIKTDVYIHPNITGIGLTDFDKADTIVNRGIVAAKKVLDNYKEIKNLKSDKKYYKISPKKPDSVTFQQVIINGSKRYKRGYILSKLSMHTGEKVSFDDLLEGINNLIGTNNYDYVHYRIINNNKTLILNLKEKNEKAFLQIGFHFDPLYKINVIGNFERNNLFAKNDLLSVDIIGGELPRFNFDYSVDNGFGLNISWHSGFHRFKTQVKSDLFFDNNVSINKMDLNVEQFNNSLNFLATINHSIYFRTGIHHRYKRYYSYVFSGENINLPYILGRNHYFGTYAGIYIDSRDDYDFPKKGLKLVAEWNYFPFSSDYYQDFNSYSLYRFRIEKSQKLAGNLFIKPLIHVGYIYSKQVNLENNFYIGGVNNYLNFNNFDSFMPISSLSIRATKYINTSLAFDYVLFKKHHINIGGHYLIYDHSDDILGTLYSNIYGYNIMYAYESFLGPIKISFGRTPQNQTNVYSFGFGYSF